MEVRVDHNGEILVRGENVATAYRHKGQTLSVAEPDDWFRTGDVAEKDENGRLYFKGRRKNVIVTPAGMNIYPEDLEKALRAQPGVRDCVVIGLERNGNAEPCAVLLLNGSASDAATVIEAANQSLAGYQKMHQWFVWPEPDFPRTPTEKPILPRIRDIVQNGKSGTMENTSFRLGRIDQPHYRPLHSTELQGRQSRNRSTPYFPRSRRTHERSRRAPSGGPDGGSVSRRRHGRPTLRNSWHKVRLLRFSTSTLLGRNIGSSLLRALLSITCLLGPRPIFSLLPVFAAARISKDYTDRSL